LAIELVKEGLHGVSIQQLLSLTKVRIRAIYQSVHHTAALSGPPIVGDAQFYLNARNGKDRSGFEWNLQGALFLHAYQSIQSAMDGYKVNRGWLLLNAYRAYRRWTRPLEPRKTPLLNINQGYSLLRMSNLCNPGEFGELALTYCENCNRRYLVSLKHELITQVCPIEAMEDYHRRRTQRVITARKVSKTPRTRA